MTANTVIVVINARLLRIKTDPQNKAGEQGTPSDKEQSVGNDRDEIETTKQETKL
jgi:hypothetical protein